MTTGCGDGICVPYFALKGNGLRRIIGLVFACLQLGKCYAQESHELKAPVAQVAGITIEANSKIKVTPFMCAEGVYLQFRNSDALTERFRRRMKAGGCRLLESREGAAHVIELHGYIRLQDRFYRPGAVDIGDYLTVISSPSRDQDADIEVARTHAISPEVGSGSIPPSLVGSVGGAFLLDQAVAIFRNIMDEPKEGKTDAFMRRRFLGLEKRDLTTQVWGAYLQLGVTPPRLAKSFVPDNGAVWTARATSQDQFITAASMIDAAIKSAEESLFGE